MTHFRSFTWKSTLAGCACLATIFSSSGALASTNGEYASKNTTSGNLIAQTTTTDPIPDTAGKEINDEFIDFLNSEFAPQESTRIITVPVENFVYVKGGVGLPKGDVNQTIFHGFFEENFGVLCGSSVVVVHPPATCSATSAFSPPLSEHQIKRLSSVVLVFNYAYSVFSKSVETSQLPTSRLRVSVINVTTGKTTFEETLDISPKGSSIKFDITKAIFNGGSGTYAVKLLLVSPKTFPYPTTSVAGFNNVTVNVTKAF